VELKRRSPDAICIALHPGTVATGLSAPFSKDGLEIQTAEGSAARLLDVINQLAPAQTGGFFDHLGVTIAW
jgi:hypothetical protein